MNHATTDCVGRVHHARRKKATDIVQANRGLRLQDAETERCGRSAKGQTQSNTRADAAAGFLKTVFMPKLCVVSQAVITDDTTAKAAARHVYKSLALLAALYDIEPLQTKEFPYPYNIALAIRNADKLLEKKIDNFQGLRLVRQGKRILFISEERYRTGSTLFYIPVQPLYRMLHNPKHRKAACLLLSVCSYLYHIADLPYYRQERTYLYWQYEMISEMILNDGEDEYSEAFKSEYRQAFDVGDIMEKKICNRSNLAIFQQRLENFCCSNEFDNSCYRIANSTFELYRQYPKESIFRYAGRIDIDKQKDDYGDHSLITMDRYISFIYSTQDSIYSSYISDMVNNDLNEYAEVDEPVLRRYFDGRKTAVENFDFEQRLFSLLNELAFLLSNY